MFISYFSFNKILKITSKEFFSIIVFTKDLNGIENLILQIFIFVINSKINFFFQLGSVLNTCDGKDTVIESNNINLAQKICTNPQFENQKVSALLSESTQRKHNNAPIKEVAMDHAYDIMQISSITSNKQIPCFSFQQPTPQNQSFEKYETVFSQVKKIKNSLIIHGQFTNEEMIIPQQVIQGLQMLGENVSDIRLVEMFKDCDQQQAVSLVNNGGIYEGQWSHGIRNGYGKLLYEDHSYYEGYWINNVRHFQGRFVDQEGDAYTGQWFSDNMFGDGKFYHNDGTSYERHTGLIKRSQQCKGAKKPTKIYPDGKSYYGEFINGKRHGFGVSIQKDLTEYYGFYKNDLPDGYGFLAYADKRTFQGQWANGTKNGFGEFTWPSGQLFIGNYKNDIKEGYGMFIYPNGQKYRGQYQEGEMTGYGRMVDVQGKCIEAQWENGKRTKQQKIKNTSSGQNQPQSNALFIYNDLDPLKVDQMNVDIQGGNGGEKQDKNQEGVKNKDHDLNFGIPPPNSIDLAAIGAVIIYVEKKVKSKICCHCAVF